MRDTKSEAVIQTLRKEEGGPVSKKFFGVPGVSLVEEEWGGVRVRVRVRVRVNPRRAFVADVAGTTFVLLDIVLRTGEKPMSTRYQQLENNIIAFTLGRGIVYLAWHW